MRRRLLNLLTALSLLLFVAVGVIWAGSYRRSSARFDWWSIGSGQYEFRVRGVYTRRSAVVLYVADYPRKDATGLVYQSYHTDWSSPPTPGTLGFSVEQPPPAFYAPGVAWRECRVPCWFLLVVFGLAPFRRAAQAARAVSRSPARRTGHCPQCGYDLRATPNGCPECGQAA